MAKLHRRRRLPVPRTKRGKGHHAASEMNGAVKADLKEHLGRSTAAHEKLAQHDVAAAAPEHAAVESPQAAPQEMAPQQQTAPEQTGKTAGD